MQPSPALGPPRRPLCPAWRVIRWLGRRPPPDQEPPLLGEASDAQIHSTQRPMRMSSLLLKLLTARPRLITWPHPRHPAEASSLSVTCSDTCALLHLPACCPPASPRKLPPGTPGTSVPLNLWALFGLRLTLAPGACIQTPKLSSSDFCWLRLLTVLGRLLRTLPPVPKPPGDTSHCPSSRCPCHQVRSLIGCLLRFQ